jgi:hypothetical protein
MDLVEAFSFSTITNNGYGTTNYGTSLFPLIGLTSDITNNIAKGVAAYAWGDHALAGYLTSIPTFQQSVNSGNGATNVGLLVGITDMSGSGRYANGTGMNVTNIGAGFGGSQVGVNEGEAKIGVVSHGSIQRLYNRGKAIIGNAVYGAGQFGWVGAGGSATNDGIGAFQLLVLGSNEVATTTSGGGGSILLGSGVASNYYAIAAGDGAVTHGNGSITAMGGFWGDMSHMYGLTPSQVIAAGGLTNVTSSTNLVVNLIGSLLYDTEGSNLHFEIDYSYNPDFSNFLSYSSTNSVTNWNYFNGTSFAPLTTNGLFAAYQGNPWSCLTLSGIGVQASNVYVRARAWDGMDWGSYFAGIARAGSVVIGGGNGANITESPTNVVTFLTASSGTGTITAATSFWALPIIWSNAYLKVDMSVFPTNLACKFYLDIFGDKAIFDNVTLTNRVSDLDPDRWNNIEFRKGYGQTIFIGR